MVKKERTTRRIACASLSVVVVPSLVRKNVRRWSMGHNPCWRGVCVQQALGRLGDPVSSSGFSSSAGESGSASPEDRGSLPDSYSQPSSRYLFPARSSEHLVRARRGERGGDGGVSWQQDSPAYSSGAPKAADESLSTFLTEDATSWETGDHRQQRDMTTPSSSPFPQGGQTPQSDEILKE